MNFKTSRNSCEKKNPWDLAKGNIASAQAGLDGKISGGRDTSFYPRPGYTKMKRSM